MEAVSAALAFVFVMHNVHEAVHPGNRVPLMSFRTRVRQKPLFHPAAAAAAHRGH
jgi:ABC-type nitrate/sulfonate/bicarbonate transport system ATPase subunit